MSNTKYGFIGGKEPTQGGASNSGVFSTSDVQDLVIDGNYGISYITSNLILHLDFIVYTSGNWSDISGNGGSATLSNGATFDSTNKEIDYDGTNDYSRFSRTDVNGGSWAYGQATFEFWVKPFFF